MRIRNSLLFAAIFTTSCSGSPPPPLPAPLPVPKTSMIARQPKPAASGFAALPPGSHGPFVDATGAHVSLVGRTVTRRAPGGRDAWSVRMGRFPRADLAVPHDGADSGSIALFGDGAILVAGTDGELLALAPDGRSRFQLGLRGAIAGMLSVASGDVVVSTSAGLVTSIAPDGSIRWETRVSFEQLSEPVLTASGVILIAAADGAVLALSLTGDLLWHEPAFADARHPPAVVGDRVLTDLRVDTRAFLLAGSHPAAPLTSATGAYRAHVETRRDGTPIGRVLSIVATAPDDVWALVGKLRADVRDPAPELLRWDGHTWSTVAAPKPRWHKEVFALGALPAVGELDARALVRGPGGALRLLASRDHQLAGGDDSPGDIATARAPVIFTPDGAALRERRELFTVFTRVPQGWSRNAGDLRYASSAAGKEVLCLADVCLRVDGPTAAVLPGDAQDVDPIAFVGETLWSVQMTPFRNTVASTLIRGKEIALDHLPSGALPRMSALWGSGDDDVWVLGESPTTSTTMSQFDGHAWTSVRAPLTHVSRLWGTNADDVWAVGDSGVAHFDGARWSQIVGVSGHLVSLAGSGRDDAWVGGAEGLWHVARATEAEIEPDLAGRPGLAPPATTTPSQPLAVTAIDPAYRLERAVITVDRGEPLRAALGVAAGPGGIVWLHDGHRVVELDGGKARELSPGKSSARFDCQRCLAPLGAGAGFALSGGLARFTAGNAVPDGATLTDLVAIAAAPSGALWAVSASEDDRLPHAIVRTARGARLVPGVPGAGYSDVAARADDDVWLVGATNAATDGFRAWPAGEGLAIHFDGRAFTRRRGPEGALLAVTSTAANEAWSVGLAGSLAHFTASAVEGFTIRPPTRLRAITAASPTDLWIAGDEATLLHGDGHGLRRIDTTAVSPDGALTSVIAPGSSPGWVVGPAGIFRIVPTAKAPLARSPGP